MSTATISWLAAFTVCPAPLGPTSTIVAPTARTGLGRLEVGRFPADHDRQHAATAPASRRRPGRPASEARLPSLPREGGR